MPKAALVTIPGVEIAKVGTWNASTGEWDCTAEQLTDAVRASKEPGYKAPIVKLGHIDPRFDGEPAVGRLDNLRVDASGETLLADWVGVPAWLAEIQASAYPSRSIEGYRNAVSASGETYEFVVTGLALLGATKPAIETLADVADLFGASTELDDQWRTVAAKIAASALPPVDDAKARAVVASAKLDDLERAAELWAQTQEIGSYVWVREVYTDFVILSSDGGRLWRADWTENGGQFEFSNLTPVKITYTPLASTPVAAAVHAALTPVRYRWGRTVNAAVTTDEGAQVDTTALRTQLGLPDDADDDAVLAAAVDALKEPKPVTPPGDTRAPESTPSGSETTATVDVDQKIAAAVQAALTPVLATVETVTKELAASKQTAAAAHKTQALDAAVKAGKITPAQRKDFDAQWDAAPAVVETILASIAPGTAFPVAAAGSVGEPIGDEDAQVLAAIWPESYGTKAGA